MFEQPRSFQLSLQIGDKGSIRRTEFLNQVNRTWECNFIAGQTMVSEHSNKTVPASYTLPLKTVPDPLSYEQTRFPGLRRAI